MRSDGMKLCKRPVNPAGSALSVSGSLGGKTGLTALIPACSCWPVPAYCLLRGCTWGAGTAQLDMVRKRSTVRFRNGAPGHWRSSLVISNTYPVRVSRECHFALVHAHGHLR